MSVHQDTVRLRLSAFLAALCVFVLTLLAASPEWHAGMHDEHAEQSAPIGTADHECAVTFFAGGVEALLVVCLLMLVRPLARGVQARATDQRFFARPRYWLVPSHAPPAV